MLLSLMPAVCSSEQETTDTKLAAVLSVESSETFARHAQLRAFLRFICEYEMSGRGEQLHEYLIGVEVLGQKTGYSTAENAIVRNRALSLRRKLAEHYAAEGRNALLRIEIPKGSYCPRFVEVQVEADSQPASAHESRAPTDELAASNGDRLATTIKTVLVCVALAAAFLGVGYRWGQVRATSIDPVLAEAWGPLLSHGSHTVVSVANAPELLVRSLPDGHSAFPRLPDELNLKAWYSERYKMGPRDDLYITPNHNSPLWGDAASAITVVRLLAHANVDMEVLPERVQSPFALRNRNAIVIGRPENSPASALFLKDMYFNLQYSPQLLDQEISWNDPATGRPIFRQRTPNRVHGLITVTHERASDGTVTQLAIFSGVNSAGAIAAAEFFSSAEHMRDFKRRLEKDGLRHFPDCYQIIVSAAESSYLPFDFDVEDYKVVRR